MPFASSMRRTRLTWTSLRLRVQAFARTLGKCDASNRRRIHLAIIGVRVERRNRSPRRHSRARFVQNQFHQLPRASVDEVGWHYVGLPSQVRARRLSPPLRRNPLPMHVPARRTDRCPRRVSELDPPATFLRFGSRGLRSVAHLRFHSTATDGISCVHVVHEFSDQRFFVCFFTHAASVHDASLPFTTVHGAFRPIVDPRSVHFAASELPFVPISVGEMHHAVSVRHACFGNAFVRGA
mmetsp:Transcript_3388/g.21184  ORF Transcript_3388/g.21184 Transcript_3388/m.21184 type:complete len:238 (+) Transcript_3388:618-1331(+)